MSLFDQKILMDRIKEEFGKQWLKSISIPNYITNNLKYPLWEWQENAIKYFIAWNDPQFDKSDNRKHLMFNMATGTGKTLIMATLILYYYNAGYRRFLFFVNQNNIINKTEANFINPNHPKYLFTPQIMINNTAVRIKTVEQFDNSDAIQIKFTTIHKLHNAVYMEKEGQTTLDDFKKQKIVMLGDEAHHFNTATKKQSYLDLNFQMKDNTSQDAIERSWEDTIEKKILANHPEHRLCEFTATIPELDNVKEKYRNKTIYRYIMSDFYQSKHTKEVMLFSNNFDNKHKILCALLFNWYRSHIALNCQLTHHKPIILFRSKTIIDSRQDYDNFFDIMNNFNAGDIDELLNKLQNFQRKDSSDLEHGQNRILSILKYINEKSIQSYQIAEWLKQEFNNPNKVVITNSKDDKTKENTDKNVASQLNNLEDKNNPIRAIFSVHRLTEGWDVLNLFDIVRLYTGRDATKDAKGKLKAGKATTAEVQLIGRGIRYYPFILNDGQNKNQRKYDNNLENPARILEELYYHSDDDIDYIRELKQALDDAGITITEKKQVSLDLKDDFKKSEFFKEHFIWQNERLENSDYKTQTFKSLFMNPPFFQPNQNNAYIYNTMAKMTLAGGFDDNNKLIDSVHSANNRTDKVYLSEIPIELWQKAISILACNENSLYRYENIIGELELNTINELWDNNHLGKLTINITHDQENWTKIPRKFILQNILCPLLLELAQEIGKISVKFYGSDFRRVFINQVFNKPKLRLTDKTPKKVMNMATGLYLNKQGVNHEYNPT